MSLFGALMGELEDDPFMGNQLRGLNSIMGGLLRDPFGDMMRRSMGAELMPYGGNRNSNPRGQVARFDDFGMGFPMMGMGFPVMRSIFQGAGDPNCHSFSSSTVMTMTAGPDGRPQVYQASQSIKQGPGGVRETKKTVADSRTGVKKMSIGHHINDRAHIIEREQNVYSGQREERQDFINLDEEEAEDFNKEWEAKTRHMMRGSGNAIDYGKHSRRRPQGSSAQLALPSTQSSRLSAPAGNRRPSSHTAYNSLTPYPHSSRESEEEGRWDERHGGKKRKTESSIVIEEVEDSEDEQDMPKRKQMKVQPSPPSPTPIVRSPTPSSASSDEDDNPQEELEDEASDDE